jgi:hypothetical protein
MRAVGNEPVDHRWDSPIVTATARIGRNMRRGIAVCILTLAVVPAFVAAQIPSPAPRSTTELATLYREAHDRHDSAAVLTLFYWGKSTRATHSMIASFIGHDLAIAIRTVSIAPLDSGDITRYTAAGVTYEMTLPAVAKLRIDFLPRADSSRRGRYTSEQTTYFIGTEGGRFWLITAQPVSP